jgi:zinc transport system ATP-binding protein
VTPPLVALRDVEVSYGDVRVLEHITLAVQPRDVLGLIGPNGSGKSTLVRIMLGLLAPDRGEVRLFGTPPSQVRDWMRIGYVPQRLIVDPTLPATVEEVVATGRLATGRSRPGARDDRMGELLNRVGLAGQRRTRMGALSAGQQQRVLLARALITVPELLVLDEPTSGIDPDGQTTFYDLLGDLNRHSGLTVILVSHDIGVVAKVVTTLACLNRRLVFHGPPATFLGDETALAALYGPAMRLVAHEHP